MLKLEPEMGRANGGQMGTSRVLKVEVNGAGHCIESGSRGAEVAEVPLWSPPRDDLIQKCWVVAQFLFSGEGGCLEIASHGIESASHGIDIARVPLGVPLRCSDVSSCVSTCCSEGRMY